MNVFESSSSNFDQIALEFLVEKLNNLQKSKEKITIALSGGTTPMPILQKLRNENLHWDRFHFFMVDERCVPLHDAKSNYGTIKGLFYDHIVSHSYSMINEDLSIEESIMDYKSDILNRVKLDDKGLPVFDLMLLGIGEDGHTASLFPGTDALNETKEIVVINYVSKLKTNRITLTYPVILNTSEIVVLIKGRNKKQVFDQLYTQKNTSYPMQKIVDKRSDLNWIIETE
ncbi:6-phosphogluconolactonase [Aquimarina sp. Aq107]|uniref:6-phosphogluconolactonase n=1 Tax=Aquimarina sp. Aq107 TaxID=1191912 RepID=UPI000D55FDCF|nr:6-phosphogluconolactonase [Aquimarina sp. Aq107]